MELAAEIRAELMTAGAEAVTFNAPLSAERAGALVALVGEAGCRSVVDLGCGRGELALLLADALPSVAVVGVDTDAEAIKEAQRRAVDRRLASRVSFAVGDAAAWSGSVDAAVCIGASHAFGGSSAMFEHLARLVSTGTAVVGDGVWQTAPDQWCLDNFGPQPVGLAGLEANALAAGWRIVDSDLSSQSEWDRFEQGWTAGVRAVGTAHAEAFAAGREQQYLNHYRSVLGFGWLVLSRQL